MPPFLQLLSRGVVFRLSAIVFGLALLVAGLGAPVAAHAAEAPRRVYNVPKGEAEKSLKLFSEQSGRGVIFSTDALKEVQTNAVQGELSAREALERMVKDTGLVIGIEEKTGAFAVRKGAADPNGSRAAPATAGDRPGQNAASTQNLQTPAVSQSVGSATVTGRVQNVVTGQYLNKARVSIKGTALTTFTDEFGRYRLVNVRSGPIVLEVFYTDLDRQEIAVNVPGSGNVEQDVNLTSVARYGQDPGIVRLDPFLVSQDKETDGKAIAINEQRFAPNIKNVLATDSFGDVLGSNVGEFLKFIPGLTAEYSEVEIIGVSVRGLGSDKAAFTSDGAPLVSATQGAASRSFNMNALSLNNLSRVEVTKVPTPASPADSLGGSINMVSKSAFERSRAQFNFGVSLVGDTENFTLNKTPQTHGDHLAQKILPGFDFDYTVPLGKNFGVVLTGFQSNKYNEQHLSTMLHAASGTGTGASFAKPFLQQYTLQDGPRSQRRTTFSLKADWRVTPNSVLSFGAQRNRNVVFIGTQNWVMNAGTVGTSTTSGGVPLSYGENFTVGPTGRGAVTIAGNGSGAAYATDGANLNYRYDDGRWKVEASANRSISSIWQPRSAGVPNRTTGRGSFSTISSTLISSARVSFADATADRPGSIKVYDDANREIDIYDIRNYRLNTATSGEYDNRNNAASASMNVRRRFTLFPFPSSLQLGAYRSEVNVDTRRQSAVTTYNGPDGNPNTPDTPAPYLFQVYRNQDSFYGFRNVPWTSSDRAYSAFVANPGLFSQTPAQVLAQETFRLTNSEYVAEAVSALYAQGEASLFSNRLTILTGVRFEKTTDEGEGSLLDSNAVFVRNADGTFTHTATGARIRKPEAGAAGSLEELYLTRKERAFKNRRSFDGYFPSLHLTYRIKEAFQARLAYAKTYGRPNFSDIIPNATFSERDLTEAELNNPETVRGTVTIRNTALKPWSADNYDLSLEYYTQSGGIVSGGLFLKGIKDFFGSAVKLATAADLEQVGLDSRYVNWNLSTKFNAGDARIKGAEINIRQSLRPLGRWGNYFTVFANGTKLELDGSKQADFTSFIPKTANWGVSFSRKQVTVGARWNYRGLNRLGAQPAYGPDAFQYYAARTYLDLNGSYQINRRFSLNASVSNATNVPQLLLRYGSVTPAYGRQNRTSEFAVAWALGLKGSF